MSTDFRALCVELIDALDSGIPAGRIRMSPLADRARAALAEADGPAVPEGREPASVAMQPSDEQLLASVRHFYGDQTAADMGAEDDLRTARAVLAQFARPAAAPVPDFGELAAALKVIDKMQQQWVLLGNDDNGTASPSLSMPISLRRFTVPRDVLFRAATLLQQQAAPVPVSERLPGPGDCDAEGRCWWWRTDDADEWWELLCISDAREYNAGCGNARYTHWLPANALPLPAPEVQP